VLGKLPVLDTVKLEGGRIDLAVLGLEGAEAPRCVPRTLLSTARRLPSAMIADIGNVISGNAVKYFLEFSRPACWPARWWE
jgi:hypothetical protein